MNFYKVCVIGPIKCGKTKLISISNGRFVKNHRYIPTLGFNTELVKVDNDFLKVYDFSGDDRYIQECLNEIKDIDFLIVFEGYNEKYQKIIDDYHHIVIKQNAELNPDIFKYILKYLEY